MPMYGYKCEAGHELAVKYSIMETTPEEVTCPDGCEYKAKRVFSSPAIGFKGSGFYTNDKKRQNGE